MGCWGGVTGFQLENGIDKSVLISGVHLIKFDSSRGDMQAHAGSDSGQSRICRLAKPDTASP